MSSRETRLAEQVRAMNVTVLLGGPSDEREVSLKSGKAVAHALRQAGHHVFESDVHPDDLSGLERPCDVVFPVLHGRFGESGELQQILEERRLCFVGSGSRASRLGMDKVAAKRAWQAAGLPTPAYRVLSRDDVARGVNDIPSSCVVKAIDSGSSIDIYVCSAAAECPADAQHAIQSVLAKHQKVLVEQFIDGPELTVGLIEEQPLDPIRIVVKRQFFDYQAKYEGHGTEHRFDTGLPAQVIERCRELAKRANDVLGCRDLARVDIMLDQDHQPYLLEINTLPGFTQVSLLPEAAAHRGITFAQLVDRLVRRAHGRGPG
jgi:D-alanine-D-alanine ligase